jgi:hypothetical protein
MIFHSTAAAGPGQQKGLFVDSGFQQFDRGVDIEWMDKDVFSLKD